MSYETFPLLASHRGPSNIRRAALAVTVSLAIATLAFVAIVSSKQSPFVLEDATNCAEAISNYGDALSALGVARAAGSTQVNDLLANIDTARAVASALCGVPEDAIRAPPPQGGSQQGGKQQGGGPPTQQGSQGPQPQQGGQTTGQDGKQTGQTGTGGGVTDGKQTGQTGTGGGVTDGKQTGQTGTGGGQGMGPPPQQGNEGGQQGGAGQSQQGVQQDGKQTGQQTGTGGGQGMGMPPQQGGTAGGQGIGMAQGSQSEQAALTNGIGQQQQGAPQGQTGQQQPQNGQGQLPPVSGQQQGPVGKSGATPPPPSK